MIDLPSNERLPVSLFPSVALAANGEFVVYAAQRDDTTRLYLRRIKQIASPMLRRQVLVDERLHRWVQNLDPPPD